MARPRVFVSSTFYDLKHIRASLEVFIESLGFDAVLFEKGDIAFHPDTALDESCYREAASADIFVLIIGGRYGSASSTSQNDPDDDPSEIYESVTKKEFEAAQSNDVPTFILLESAVSAEFQTYLKNKDSNDIRYAHVDSVGVFRLIESIFSLSRNNPVFNFERATQIEVWLREQWSGLFRELLRSRTQQKQLSALNLQVSELKSINDTLRTYMEIILSKVDPSSEGVIKKESIKLEREKNELNLELNPFFRYLVKGGGLSESSAIDLIESDYTADDLIDRLDEIANDGSESNLRGTILRRVSAAQRDFNKARVILSKPEVDFSSSKYPDVVRTASRPGLARAIRNQSAHRSLDSDSVQSRLDKNDSKNQSDQPGKSGESDNG